VLTINQPGLLNADLSQSVNLFLGAGFSTMAFNANSKKLPTGTELKKLILEEFKRSDLEALDLQSLYAVLANERKQQIDEFLTNTFTVTRWDPLYDALRILNVSHVYTTNIDNLASKIFRPIDGQVSPVFHDVQRYGEPIDVGRSIQFIPLHGSVDHEAADYIFTAGQIASAFASDQKTWYVFQRELQRRPTFFLGYGMGDAGVLQSLHNASQPRTNRWILVLPGQDAAVALYESLGFNVLQGTASDFLEHLGSIETKTPSDLPTYRDILGRIPRTDEIAQRPIKSFFLGAEPSWSDAYSPNIERRSVNSKVLDAALSSKNVAIVGLPLSGKSTILRQVAVDLSNTRECLFFDRLGVDTANAVIAEHAESTTKPVVCIDQFIDSREGFNVLAGAKGFRFIVAESSVFFDAINIRNLPETLSVVSCSDVPLADLQRILSSMPIDIKRSDPEFGEMREDVDQIGLFESLVKHIFDRELKARFRQKLNEFHARDPQAFGAYLMACYSHACRTLVSYDMLHLFLAPKDYHEGYSVASRIREFVAETDNEDDDTQDHFAVRSSALSRLALWQSSKDAFSEMYRQFHNRVSPRVIPDFPTFRRYAYDNDFAVRAFPNYRDGKAFYEQLFARDDNAYDYQHGAVYMSKLGQYGVAFDWIERALSKAGAWRYSIRNSHAVILFDANFGVFQKDPDNRDAFDGIRRSMEVLEDCITGDKWRRYHLLRFSDQAMQTAAVARTPEVEQWLTFAQERIGKALDEARRPGSREVYNLQKYRRLQREVEAVVSRTNLEIKR
jgi:tetratricopeptide (TPR) repeat protein